MTLQEAIKLILEKSRSPLLPDQIAKEINKKGLYKRQDGGTVSKYQIQARAENYPDIFELNNDSTIGLANQALRLNEIFAKKLSKVIGQNAYDSNFWVSVFTIIARFHKLNPASRKRFEYGSGYKSFFIDVLKELDKQEPFREIFRSIIYRLDTGFADYTMERVFQLISEYQSNNHFYLEPEDFSSFFNDLVNDFFWQSKDGYQSSTPKSLANLIAGLVDIKDDDLVEDPFAGKAGMLVAVAHKNRNIRHYILAGDINESSVSIGALNLAVAGTDFHYTKQNAFEFSSDKKVDWIISNPPFGNLDPSSLTESIVNSRLFSASRDFSTMAVQVAMDRLKANGKAILVVSDSFLFSTTKSISIVRKSLIENGFLSTIISLPTGVFAPALGLKTSVIVIDKSIRNDHSIYFYDASEIHVKELSKYVDQIVESANQRLETTGKAKNVYYEDIVRNDYNLSVNKYFTPDIAYNKKYLQPIENLLLNCFSGINIQKNNLNTHQGMPYVNVADLPSDPAVRFLQTQSIPNKVSDIELVKGVVKPIPYNAILISKIGEKLKPVIFNDEKESLCSKNIMVLEFNTNKVLSEYILTQFQEPYFQSQLLQFQKGSMLPRLTQLDFVKLLIDIPDIPTQRQVIESYGTGNSVENDKKIDTELYNIISRINHELKTPISSIGMDIQSLLYFFKNNNSQTDLNTITVPLFDGQKAEDMEGAKLGSLLSRVLKCVDHSQEVLAKAEDTLKIGKNDLHKMKTFIKEFINTEVLPIYENKNCKIQISGKDFQVEFDKYQLKSLFMNLIDNALKHGFIEGSEKHTNIIRITLEGKHPENGMYLFTVSNNGKPFGEGFTIEHFFQNGMKSDNSRGSGFGGFHIKKVVENHRGQIKIVPQDEVVFSEFKVQFKISLP